MFRLLFLMLSGAAVASAAGTDLETQDPSALLRRVAATYQGIIDYRVEVETKVVSTPWKNDLTRTRYLLAASKPKLMFTEATVMEPIKEDVRLATEDCRGWVYAPKKRAYVIDDNCSGVAAELRKQHARLFRRFELLDSMDIEAHITGSQGQSDGEHKVRCILLRLTPRKGNEWTEDLWVDENRCIVLKSVMEERRLFETIIMTTMWRKFRINEPVEPAVFQFVPPRDTRETNRINVP